MTMKSLPLIKQIDMAHSKKFNINYHFDAGHGWFEVSNDKVLRVGLRGDNFSHFSYAKLVGFTPTYYLEHDCDWLTFLKAANFKEYEIEINEIDDGLDSPIRSYSNIQGK